MDDAAVVAGLVDGDVVLLVHHRDPGVGAQLGQPAGDGHADDPRPDHADAHRTTYLCSDAADRPTTAADVLR